MRHHSLFIVSSLALISACTQPPAMVELRGSQDYGRDGKGLAFAAPVATPYKTAQPIYNAQRAQYDQAAAGQPTQSTAPVGSSIMVNDLAPAAGGTQTPAPVSNSQATSQHVLKLPEQKVGFTKPAAKEPAPAIKEVVLKKADEPVPANSWTKKPRDEASFTGKTAQEANYIWPVTSHAVTTAFGSKGNDGISINAQEGEPVWASADGEVIYADSKMKGYGKMIIVKHNGGKTTTYAHLARYGVEKYDRVKQGDIIGYVGSTGNVKAPQLYFSMRDGTQAIDPQKYLDRKVAGL